MSTEYLVTMTTHVPAGTTDAEVEQMRTREAARSRELAVQGHLLRLWRPPLQPGEWRTLGLFAAPDDTQLEKVLASMPLRVWRTDVVTPLAPHPQDPGRAARPGAEFLTRTHEGSPAVELGGPGQLLRLWQLPEPGHTLGLWQAHDLAEMQQIVASLPPGPWQASQLTPLTPHPSDPAGAGGQP
jgi:muconolactone delta-isomerase